MQSKKQRATDFIKNRALELGFMECGIASSRYLEEEAPHLEKWLKQGNQGKMTYLENHFDLRLDPGKLVPGARSVVVLLLNYFPEVPLSERNNYKIARYAYGKDYHFVIKQKLKQLLHEFQDKFGEVSGRVFIDSAPLLERKWAENAGLGWRGKNTLLLNQKKGSYFFLAEMVVDFEFEYDSPVSDHCGTCTACIDACPTDALSPFWMDSNRCISYLTIELRDQIDNQFEGKFNDWIFGCDICQEVCPWNRFATPHNESEFEPSEDLVRMNKTSWEELTESEYRQLFRKSAVKRTGYNGLKRNIDFATRVP